MKRKLNTPCFLFSMRWLATLLSLLIVGGVLELIPHRAVADPSDYTFTPVVYLGDPAPGGGAYMNDIEVNHLLNSGKVAFGTDLIPQDEGFLEGIFIGRKGEITDIVRGGQTIPGGVVGAYLATMGLNEAGDTAFAVSLDGPIFLFPPEGHWGLYRTFHNKQGLVPVVVPNVTPAPGGGTFVGAGFGTILNSRGDIAFNGIVPSDKGSDPSSGLGYGIFLANRSGQITKVVSPGDAAPGGGTFADAGNPWINDQGDIAFAANLVGADSHVYVKKANGQIEVIANTGDAAPGGGVFLNVFGGSGANQLNNRGDLAFIGVLEPGPLPDTAVLFLRSQGRTVRVAGPGDPMPGGGNIKVIGTFAQFSLNQVGDLAFNAALDTGEEGMYLFSRGVVRLVAKTGAQIPGVGTIFSLEQGNSTVPGFPPNPTGIPNSWAALNDHGEVAFTITLTDTRIVLLIATPKPQAAPPLAVGKPSRSVLGQNYPDPFNPETWIPFQLARSTDVTITIYNAWGQRVRTLSLGILPAGLYLTKDKAAYWDGRSDSGERVASGVYLYHFRSGDDSATRKMLILK